MQEVDNIDCYKLYLCSEQEKDIMYNLLFDVVIPKSIHKSQIKSEIRRLRNSINESISNKMSYIVCWKGIPVGCAVLDNNSKPVIWHINILAEYTNSIASLLLNNYILNVVFKDMEVFVFNSHDITTFRSVIEEHKYGYKIKNSVSKKLFDMYNKLKK